MLCSLTSLLLQDVFPRNDELRDSATFVVDVMREGTEERYRKLQAELAAPQMVRLQTNHGSRNLFQ